MKFRSRRLLTETTAPIAWRMGRMARMGGQAAPDTAVERFVYAEKKLMAAPIPKVASRTLKQMIGDLSGHAEGGEIECRPEEIRPQYPDFYIFSLVRNPWSRIYSCWKDKIQDAYTPGKVSILSRFPSLRPFMPFEEFVEWLSTPAGSDAYADRHWMSQLCHLDAGGGAVLCNHVGKMEQIEDAFEEVERQTGVMLPRTKRQNAKTTEAEYLGAFSDRARRIVEMRYGDDIEAFGYTFEG